MNQVGERISDYFRYGWQLLNGFRAAGELRIAKERENDIASFARLSIPLRVLDLGNGSLRPQYTLLRSAGHHVYGIDLINRPDRSAFSTAYSVARSVYRWKLGLSVKDDNRGLVCGDVCHLPFPDGAFDLVTSVAAFEHFLNAPAVVLEIRRVLRPGGLIYARIHLFTCPSGGHNVRVTEIPLHKLPKGVDAWDHLRKRRLPIDVPLNEWRRDRYLEEFGKRFDILKHYCAMREGEDLLTPEIENELSNYSRDELTCGAYVIVARRRA